MMRDSAQLLQPAREYFISALGEAVCLVVGLLTYWLIATPVNLVLILGGAVAIITVVSGFMEAHCVHIAWRLVMDVALLGATMAWLYFRGDVYAPQAAIAVVAGLVIINSVSFAKTAVDGSNLPRLAPLIALVSTLFLTYAAFKLPNEGLLTLTILLAVIALFRLIWPKPTGGSVFGPLGWALFFYAWLANAALISVFAPLFIVLVDVFWTLFTRLLTRRGRATLPIHSSWWSKVNAWTLPGNDLLVQRLATQKSPLLAESVVFGFTLLCVLAAVLAWQFLLGTKILLLALLILGIGYLAITLLGSKTQQKS